jgi:excisionase family DNA binding protein
MLTTAEAAAILQVSRRRVNELIKLGTLHAEKRGRDWQIDEASVDAYRHSARKPGRLARSSKSD